MSYFTDVSSSAITPVPIDGQIHALELGSGTQDQVSRHGLERLGTSAGAESVELNQVGLKDQFIVFQLNPSKEGPTILDSTEVEPSLDGSDQDPDVLVSAAMLSFHLAENANVDPDTRATLRMNFGKDENSTDKRFDAVFWSVASGLSLYDQYKKKASEPKDLKSDFQQAFSGRPIEIPGGLGRITFDVVKHKEPPWWKKIFTFAESGTGKALISTLGFPAITMQAISFVDQLLDKLDGSSPDILFKGFPMRLAFSSYARDAFTGGNPRVKVGCLNRGFMVFTRGGDFEAVAKSNATYVPGYNKLVPADVKPAALLSGSYDDPLKNVTYAVFRMGTKKTKLDPTFQYGP